MTKYPNASSFRRALEDRLNQISKAEGIEIQRLRREVVFSRLLSRLFRSPGSPWVLKGGYAMQLRISKARATRDVDLAMREIRLASTRGNERNEAILETLQEHADQDLGDYFTFLIADSKVELDGPPYGGTRFHVEARLDGRSFEKFHLDIGIGDVWIEPFEKLTPKEWLGFAGVKTKAFSVISKEQQFAEKLHAYTHPRTQREKNSRVKDLVDMNLLIQTSEMDGRKLNTALSKTFQRRDTHPLDLNISPPPATWGASFTSMAIECGLPSEIKLGFETVYSFLKKLEAIS
jgi:hypothetical protein